MEKLTETCTAKHWEETNLHWLGEYQTINSVNTTYKMTNGEVKIVLNWLQAVKQGRVYAAIKTRHLFDEFS